VTGERYVPHVIEPAAGVDRAMLAFMVDAYDEEVVPASGNGEGAGDRSEIGQRTLLRLHPQLSPVKVAVLPLLRKDGHPELAREVYEAVRRTVQSEYDEGGSIGKRYRRQDEIGTPFCLTIDHESIEDRTITLRDRDSLSQERVPIDGIAREIERRVSAPWKTPKLAQS
jgi:glycyl-tRNA synthetase